MLSRWLALLCGWRSSCCAIVGNTWSVWWFSPQSHGVVSIWQGSQGEEHSNEAVMPYYPQLLRQLTCVLAKAVGSLYQVICVWYGAVSYDRLVIQSNITSADRAGNRCVTLNLICIWIFLCWDPSELLHYPDLLQSTENKNGSLRGHQRQHSKKHFKTFGTDGMTFYVGGPMVYHLLELGAGSSNKHTTTVGRYLLLPSL